jgi:NDP-sugar pyrophosphorylase family protein
MADNLVTGELFTGLWMDIGTPERLQHINEHYCK